MKYEVIRERYSSDMSDAAFALIRPPPPAPKQRGRKPTQRIARGAAKTAMVKA